VTSAYPASHVEFSHVHYNIWTNRLGFDSVTLKTADSLTIFKAASISVSGINVWKLISQNDHTPDIFTKSVMNAGDVLWKVRKSGNELRCKTLHISVPDSEMTADSITYRSSYTDGEFFANSRFRQTRYRFEALQGIISRCAVLEMLEGNAYTAGSITLHDFFADIFVNIDKPYNANTSNPEMPNEAFAKMKEAVNIDTLKIINGRLKYSERYVAKAKPGIITFSKVNLIASNISNHPQKPDIAVIHAAAVFMNESALNLFMTIPLMTKHFSLKYSGTFGKMPAGRLNSFIEPGQHHRIESGDLKSASFAINVNSGHARGTLRMAYEDLYIAVIDKKTGSDKGFFNKLSSLFGEIFIIRGNNIPDAHGKMKIGTIEYVRKPGDYFSQFIWFALRSGVGNVVGF